MLNTIIGILATAILGCLAWAFQINSKVDVQEVEIRGVKELIEQKFEALEKFLDAKDKSDDKRLERIERALNGHLRG